MVDQIKILVRWKVIDECLRTNGSKWKKKELAEKINEYIDSLDSDNIPYATEERVRKDIGKLRELHPGIPIPYGNAANEGYFYTDPDFSIFKVKLKEKELNNIKEMLLYLKQFKDTQLFSGFNNAINKVSRKVEVLNSNDTLNKIIEFESIQSENESQIFDLLLKAIKEQKVIGFYYKHMYIEKESGYKTFVPKKLKQYRERWYLIGKNLGKNKVEHFTVERISNLEIKKQATVEDLNFEIHPENVIGVNHMSEKPEEVIFKADKHQTKYLEERKLHDSQEKISESDENGWDTYRIIVVPNEELKMHMLQWGDRIQVLKPESFRNFIKKTVGNMMGYYEG